MVQVCLRLNDELVALVDAEAQRTGLRRSDVIRQLLLRQLRAESAEAELTLGQRFGHFAGIVRSGVPDLGTRHREHLAKDFGDGR
jgi:hypothetical protein